MRIGVMGASGRVGLRVVEAILADPGLELAAALVSPTSKVIGMAVAGGSLEYRPIEPSMNCHCDVFIDFSTPKASLTLQESMGEKSIPVVIGTTGFDAEQEAELTRHAARRPLLIEPNFALGFDGFEASVAEWARRDPGAEATVSETYHARKKPEPSGTSRRIAAMVGRIRREATGLDFGLPPILVRREGDVVGTTVVRFDLGTAEIVLTHQVASIAAFADGALAAARRLASQPRSPGRYGLDTLRTPEDIR